MYVPENNTALCELCYNLFWREISRIVFNEQTQENIILSQKKGVYSYMHVPVLRWHTPWPWVQLHSLKHDSVVLPVEHEFSQFSPLKPGPQLHIPMTGLHDTVLLRMHEQLRKHSLPNCHLPHFSSHLILINKFPP